MARISKEEQAKNVAFWQQIKKAAEAAKVIVEHRKWSMLTDYWFSECGEGKDKIEGFFVCVLHEPSGYPQRVKHAKFIEADFMRTQYDTEQALYDLRFVFSSVNFREVNDGSEITSTDAFLEEIGIPEWEIVDGTRKMPKREKFKAACENSVSNAKGLARYAKKMIRAKAEPMTMQEACISAYARAHHWE